ncbi:MAG TPA: ABC transporter substrate-binding protein [Candidatus Limnocylindria bacterium]|nr:ABC transporter substrate-binding protein [Candidatus Limnocylindria bacterium]
MKTRWIAIPLALTVLLSACGGGDTGGAPAAPTGTGAAAGIEVTAGSTKIRFPQPEKTSVKIGHSGTPTIGIIGQIMARGLDLYKKYGITVEYVYFNGAAQSAQALIAGQIDVNDGSAGPVIASQATTDPQRMAFVTRHNLTDFMYTRSEVKSAADLKGKNVAISSFGSQSHAGALLAIKSLGLTDKDVTIQPIGNDSARLAALRGGSVAASMQDQAIAQELTPLGFNILVKLTEVKGIGGVPRTSLIVPKSFEDKYPNTVLALTAVYLEGLTIMRKDPEGVVKYLSEYGQIPLESAKKQVEVELAAPWEPRDGRCDNTVFEFTKQVNLPSNPAIASVDPTKACTNLYLDKLKDMGFQKAIGVPGY